MEEQPTGADRVERFRAVYDAASARIVAYAARRTGVAEDAHDAVSETFLVVWRRLDDLPPGEEAEAWVYGVARRVLANQRHGRHRRLWLQARLIAEGSAGDGESSHDLIHRALTRLRPADPEFLTLVAWKGLTNEDLAAALGIDRSTVAVCPHRARRRLARELARLGVGSKAAPDEMKSSDFIRTHDRMKGIGSGTEEMEKA